jgi:hypothetical protein
MKSKLVLVLIAAVSLMACSGTPTNKIVKPDPMSFMDLITEGGLYADLSILASDSLQGRDTGSEGLKMANDYLSRKYAALGLTPVGDNDTYSQYVEFLQNQVNQITYVLRDADGNELSSGTQNAESTAGYINLRGGNTTLSGEVVFVGTGSYSEADSVNHFDTDLSGKWMLMFYDQDNSSFSAAQRAIRGGSLGGLLIMEADNQEDFDEYAESVKDSFGKPAGGLQLKYLAEQNESSGGGSAYVRVSPAEATTLLGVETMEELLGMREQILADKASFKAETTDKMLEMTPDMEKVTVTSSNVVAFIEGTDPVLKDEVVVLSAHYDHVGIGNPDESGDTIYNGADDDGSGTVGLLHAARSLQAAKEAGADLKRSVLILHVTGEERGLLGSRYYSDHPIFPIEKTVANVNVDMIGRIDDEYAKEDNGDYVYIIGGEIISSGLDSLLTVANEASVNIELSKRYNDLNDPNQFYRRSDHWNFGRLGVPFVFFFNGTHPDYHRPSDEVDKIEFEALKKRTQLLYALTVMLSNSDERPEVDNEEFIEKTQQQPRG